MSQTYGLVPLWMFMWRTKSFLWWNDLEQSLHSYFPGWGTTLNSGYSYFHIENAISMYIKQTQERKEMVITSENPSQSALSSWLVIWLFCSCLITLDGSIASNIKGSVLPSATDSLSAPIKSGSTFFFPDKCINYSSYKNHFTAFSFKRVGCLPLRCDLLTWMNIVSGSEVALLEPATGLSTNPSTCVSFIFKS